MAEEQRHPQGYLSPDIRKIDLTNTLTQTCLLLLLLLVVVVVVVLDVWTLTVGTYMMSHNVGNPMTLRYIPGEQISPPHTGESLKSHFLALFAVPTTTFKC